jgi:hypothetical protein
MYGYGYWWWWAWFAILILLVIVPLTYGWGYRGWGPPYPRYYQRRRRLRKSELDATGEPLEPVPVDESPATSHGGWGIFADLMWLVALGLIAWAIYWAWTR